ncbi:MAG: MoaD/ThiS family protein [Candidatus Zhuqueibacterota bacterium]
MRITLVFHGNLKKYNAGQPEQTLDLPEGATVAAVLELAQTPADEIAFAAVNGSRAPLSQRLSPGDEVKLFQKVGGG